MQENPVNTRDPHPCGVHADDTDDNDARRRTAATKKRRRQSFSIPLAAAARLVVGDAMARRDVDARFRVVGAHAAAHTLLDLAGHGQEGLLDVAGVLGRRLEEGDPQAVGEFLLRGERRVERFRSVKLARYFSGGRGGGRAAPLQLCTPPPSCPPCRSCFLRAAC